MRTFSADLLNDDYKLTTPFAALISGSSGAGKTTFIKNLLCNQKLDPMPKTIYYHYPPELTNIPVKVRVPESCTPYHLIPFNNMCSVRTLSSGTELWMSI